MGTVLNNSAMGVNSVESDIGLSDDVPNREFLNLIGSYVHSRLKGT